MTIRAKLTANVLLVVVMIGAVAATSFLGMRFVKEKLSYLTEKSTPFQLRTIEFQRAVQTVTSDLTKVGASHSHDEFVSSRKEADASLLAAREAQKTLETMSGERLSTSDDLAAIAGELTSVTENRLKAENEATKAGQQTTQRLKETTARLKELDSQIKALQVSRSKAYSTSADNKDAILTRVRSLEMLKTTLKELKLSIYETNRKGAKSDPGKLLNKAVQNSFVRSNPKILAEVKSLAAKIEEITKARDAGSDSRLADVNTRLDALIDDISDEADNEDEKYSAITGKQGGFQSQAAIAVTSLAANSELVALGISVEGFATRLFTVNSPKDLDIIAAETNTAFAKINTVYKNLDTSLKKIGAAREQKMLAAAVASLNGTRTILFAEEGIITKLKRKMEMEAKATAVAAKLRGIVTAQAEQGKRTAAGAQEGQEKAIATVNRIVRFNTALIGGIGIASIIIGVFFGFWIYRSVAGPLQQLLGASAQVAKGDLTGNLSDVSNDEVGEVQAKVGEMVGNLRGMVGNINDVSRDLNSSSEELSRTAVELQEGASLQTGQIEQAVTAMAEMTQTTLEVARNSSETADAAQKMKQVAEQGKGAMTETVHEMDRFALSVREASARVESLGDQSQQINEVVSLIKDIADQTNLLALNAAIEAARAGDMGRGFAVVADSVRALAERTTASTEEISHMVGGMQQSVAHAVQFMHQESSSLDKVVIHVNQTLAAIDEIVDYVGQVTDMVQRTAVAAEQQSSTSEEINHNMTAIDAVTRKLFLAFREVQTSSSSLSQLAQKLNDKVSWFKVH
ncbi:methyl-accepting chemotaxis protein [Geobacter argillaceus]|uniref:Methyl-accepting chemotaxis protein n=1 Tax=Geobacter argillaceus TaxID=345631 RepID=A0A562WSB0_9BACT|nr:methyl-accepting chemotaxis protein [Geobacter argillaceus]TWJ33475.1 methyl-accepting chemotaxis protein [Geobacter argillaceus]